MRPHTTHGKVALGIVTWGVVYCGLTALAGTSERLAGAVGAGVAIGFVQIFLDELDRVRGR